MNSLFEDLNITVKHVYYYPSRTALTSKPTTEICTRTFKCLLNEASKERLISATVGDFPSLQRRQPTVIM